MPLLNIHKLLLSTCTMLSSLPTAGNTISCTAAALPLAPDVCGRDNSGYCANAEDFEQGARCQCCEELGHGQGVLGGVLPCVAKAFGEGLQQRIVAVLPAECIAVWCLNAGGFG